MSAPGVPACSALSAVDEPLPGTAARVTDWLLIEHRGAWGRDALDGVALGDELAGELSRRADAAGVRVMLIRRPGERRADSGARITVFLAHSLPDETWCERIALADHRSLLDLELPVIGSDAPGLGTRVAEPVTLVCTHAKRDRCCAVLGRPLAAALTDAGADVWECSHTGGHRFAPSLIVLPTGYNYGRLNAADAAQVLTDARAGRVNRTGLRGRSCWDAAGQAAEVAVRENAGVPIGVDDLRVTGDSGLRTVRHRDGRSWSVRTATRTLPPRAVSCGAAPKPVDAVEVVELRENCRI